MLTMERPVTTELTFGKVVKRRREELGLSQGALGERMGIDAARVSKIERDRVSERLPERDQLLRWSEALEMDTVEILAEMGYISGPDRPLVRPPDLYTSLADEVREAGLGELEQEIVLDAIKHARRLRESRGSNALR